MKIATFDHEKSHLDAGYHLIVGVDEVGRGPLAGPVVTAACVIKDPIGFSGNMDTDARWKLIRDSKLLSEKQRKEAHIFVEEVFYIGVGLSTPDTIDRINILQATFLAMKKAIADLEHAIDKVGAYADAERMIILVDGNQIIPNFTREQKCIAKGDQKVRTIAAASIIAKVMRDTMMEQYAVQYPQYGFDAHKGYGTKMHMDALAQYGATPIHRKSFAPVRNVL